METQESALQREAGPAIDGNVTADAKTQRSVSQRAASAAHDTIDSASGKAEEIETHLRAGAAKAGIKLEESQEATMEQVEKSLAKVGSFVKGRPVAAAGIAFAAGVLATVLLRR